MRVRFLFSILGLLALGCLYHAESARLGSNEAIYQAILAADRGVSFVSVEPVADVIDDVARITEAKVATITVTCPASATITLDDYQTKQTGKSRLFHTPPLERAGTYTLRAFVCTASGCFTEAKKVHVNPGEEVSISVLSQYASAAGGCACGPNCPCTAGQCGTSGCPTLSYGQPIFFGGGCAGGACGGFGGGFMMGGGGCAGGCCGGRCR